MKKTLCLNMIVKNESKIITRCLDSVAKYIDCYVIHDTGSKDGTQKIIKDYFDKLNIKGKIYDFPWINFYQNRTVAIKDAKNKSDYILLIDADMTFKTDDEEFKEKLELDMYSIDQISNGVTYSNVRIVKGDLDYDYIGVAHEFILCKKKEFRHTRLEDLYIDDHMDGSNRIGKYERDIELLNNGLRKKDLPLGLKQRYSFFLGQSYRDLKKYDKAIKYYKLRVELGDFEEEIFYSLYQIGMLYLVQNNFTDAFMYMFKAYDKRPSRIEPLYQLIKYFRINKQYNMAKLLLMKCVTAKTPVKDTLFVETDVYNFLSQFEVVQISHHIKDHDFGRHIAEGLMHLKQVPYEIKQDAINNMFYYSKSLKTYCPSFKSNRYDIINKEYGTNNISSPSIIYNNNQYLLNTLEYFFVNGILQTYNKLYTIGSGAELDKFLNNENLNLIDTMTIEDNSKTTFYKLLNGYENIRLIDFKGKFYGLCNTVKTNPEGINEMCLLHLEPLYNIHKIVRLKCEGITNDKKIEKNWCPLVHDEKLLFLYTSEPTLFLECDIETGTCTVYKGGENSIDLTQYRGSSQIVKVNDKYIYVVHVVGIIDKKKYYYHKFVQMDKDLMIKKISPLFTFSDKPTIESCAGMCYDGKNLVLTYGVENNKCFIASVNPDEVFELSL